MSATDASVGEVVEALGVHIDPEQILTSVELDGAQYSAGDEQRWGRRSAASVARLVLTTQTPRVFAATMRHEIAAALAVIAHKVTIAIERFRTGDERAANSVLATLMEELRLALVLEQQCATLDASALSAGVSDIAALAPALLDALERRAWPELGRLLEQRLLPVLAVWRAAADHAPAPPPAAVGR